VWMEDVDGATVVPVVIIFCLFVIHVLSEFQDTASVNVTNLRMVDKNEKLVSFYQFFLKNRKPVSKPGVVRCRLAPPRENPRCGPVPGGHPRSTGTGNRDRTRWGFWTFFFFEKWFFLIGTFQCVCENGSQ
jgi:hypothetical protein